MNRSAAVVRHQSANPRLEQGSTTRFSAVSARRYVPGDSGSPCGAAPASSSMMAATPRSASSPHARGHRPEVQVPGPLGQHLLLAGVQQRLHLSRGPDIPLGTIFGLPSTQPISRRYQYGRPLITFLYRLTTNLCHR